METLRYVVLANGLLAIVSIAYYVLLRRETFFGANRLALWLSITGALVLPLLELPDWRPQRVRSMMHRTAQVIVPKVLPKSANLQPDITITFPDRTTYLAFQDQTKQFVWSWQTSLVAIYVAGVFLLFFRFCIQLISLRKLIQHSVHEPYDSFTLVRNEEIKSPFSFFGWVVVNVNQHTTSELDQILRHERVHVRERHSLDMIGAELVSIVFWFNPTVYLFRHLLHQTLEFRADRAVLAEGVDAKAYQYNLLKVSLSVGPVGFINHFSGSTLRQRIGMINSQRSGTGCWWRYIAWGITMGMMAFACRHEPQESTPALEQAFNSKTLPATSPTRALVAELEEKETWYRHLALFQSKFGTESVQSKPVILQLKNDQFVLPDDYKYDSAIYIDGKAVSVEALKNVSPEFVSELFVLHQWDNQVNRDTQAKPYQIFIQTSSQLIPFNGQRKQFFTLLQAAAISQHPLGESFSFSMNQLLEATFFHNKNALVERTKNEHLSLYDEYAGTVEIFINNLPATPADVKTIHVREVARLSTKERPYIDWFRADNPLPRFALQIQTEPKRARRDSSYYVFSPFYSGDF